MKIRDAAKEDVPYIGALEQRPEFRAFINSWPIERHMRALKDEDHRYLIFEEDGRTEGFAILDGLTSPHRAIQLRRIALSDR